MTCLEILEQCRQRHERVCLNRQPAKLWHGHDRPFERGYASVARIGLVLLFIACCGSPGRGADAPESRPSGAKPPAESESRLSAASLEALLGQLGDADWKARDRAQDGLLKLGEAARPGLERLLASHPDAETSRSATIVLANLDEALHYGPTLVTLHLHDVSPKDAFDALAARAGVTFGPAASLLWPGTDPQRVTIDVEGQPLWSVVQKMCAQAKVRVVESRSGHSIQLAGVDPKEPLAPFAVAGPFLLMVKRIEQTRAIEFAGPADGNARSGCRISLLVLAEPKLGTCKWDIQKLEKLETDDTRPFDPNFQGGSGVVGSAGEAILFQGDLHGTKVKRLRATGSFAVAGKPTSFEVDNVLKAGHAERVIGGFRVAMTELKAVAEGRYTVTVEAAPENHSAEEFKVFCATLGQLWGPRLLDTQGNDLHDGGGSSSQYMDRYIRTLNAARNDGTQEVGEPAKLIWEVPSEVKTLTLPVEFVDLPLP